MLHCSIGPNLGIILAHFGTVVAECDPDPHGKCRQHRPKISACKVFYFESQSITYILYTERERGREIESVPHQGGPFMISYVL